MIQQESQLRVADNSGADNSGATASRRLAIGTGQLDSAQPSRFFGAAAGEEDPS